MKATGAIETQYAGYRFRSRLEARYAVMFDTMGIRWEYEAEGYECGPRMTRRNNDQYSIWYLPDFWLPDLKMYVEVKGSEDGLDLLDFIDVTGSLIMPGGCCDDVGMVFLGPLPRMSWGWAPWAIHGHKGDLLMYPWRGDASRCANDVELARDTGGTWEEIRAQIEYQGSRKIDEKTMKRWLLTGAVVPPGAFREQWVNAAKSARFEHGQSGLRAV